MTTRERKEAKAERLRGWAAKREEKAATVFKDGERFQGDIAFNTQPGRIPFREKLIARENRAFESLQKARNMDARADGIEHQLDNSIYSDDPDAIEALHDRIEKLEAKREQMKARNAEYRKAHKAELKEMTAYGRSEAVPHPGWELTNLGADIRRGKRI